MQSTNVTILEWLRPQIRCPGSGKIFGMAAVSVLVVPLLIERGIYSVVSGPCSGQVLPSQRAMDGLLRSHAQSSKFRRLTGLAADAKRA